MARVTLGRISPRVVVLLTISDQRGKVREGLGTGGKKRKKGALPELLAKLALPRSSSSQLKSSASPLASLAEPVRVNGVCLGMVKPLVPALTIGAALAVLVIAAQLLPLPKVV